MADNLDLLEDEKKRRRKRKGDDFVKTLENALKPEYKSSPALEDFGKFMKGYKKTVRPLAREARAEWKHEKKRKEERLRERPL